MQYTIKAVSPQVRQFETKFGAMISYKVRFNETDDATVVEISQKSSTPAPTVGQSLEGTIDMSGPYGPKFKKEFNQGGGFGGGSASGFPGATQSQPGKAFSAPSKFDTFTMYLSYAKDVAVALVGTKDGYNQEKFNEILGDVIAGGNVLYEGRPDAPKDEAEAPKKDVAPDDDFDPATPADFSNVDATLGKGETIDTSEIPF